MSAHVPVSVLMTVFNGEAHLAEAIQSILRQTFRDLEFIIVNDGSSDSSAAIIERFAREDSRIHFENLPHVGRVEALNAGCAVSRGKYIAIHDADDVALPARLECQLRFLEDHPTAALIGAGVRKISDEGRPFSTVLFPATDGEIKERLKENGCFAHSTVVMLRRAVEEVGGYRTAFPISQDYDLWLRLSERFETANLPSVLADYRIHTDQISTVQLEPHVCQVIGAQISAARREAGLFDPMETAEAVTPELLIELGVSPVMIERRIADGYLSLAITLWEAGAFDSSIALLERARSWANAARCGRRIGARINAALAARYYKGHSFLRAAVAFARAGLDSPAEALALVRRGGSQFARG